MPLSPPPSHNGELMDHGLLHIAQHNAHSPYLEQYHDGVVHLSSHYGSPTPGREDSYSYRSHSQPPRIFYQQHQHQDSGLGNAYDNYQPEYQGQMYQDRYGTPAASPPTPSMHSQDLIRTRSGLGIPRIQHNLKPMPEGRSRADKSPKPKKAKKEKIKAEKKIAKLDKPLSELTRDWKHVPVADIETYVNRSAEERRKEVANGKIPNKVKRPMNSFMLYRKAYQNRTKDWCLQNNHQVVSQVCGDSWPLEPDEVRDQFSEWARIERINHQNAHPGYKFSPTKPGTAKATKRKMSEEPFTEESDLDDFEWQQGPSRTKKRNRSTRQEQTQHAAYSTRSSYPYSSRGNSMEPGQQAYNRSSYQASNPNKPIPQPYSQSDLHTGQYYQQTVQNNHSQMGVEDVIIRKTAAPGVHPNYLSSLPGGGQEYDLMNPDSYSQYVHPTRASEHRIDPSLMSHDQGVYNGDFGDANHPDGVYFGVESHHGDGQWQGQFDLSDPSVHLFDNPHRQEHMPIQDPHMHVLRGNQEGWHVESLDAGPEFDKWIEEE